MSVLDLSAQQLWTPQGLVGPEIREARQAVEDYDPNLSLGRHEITGDWVVLLKRPDSEAPVPIFGLGKELPSRERITEQLYKSDVRRRGGKIAEALERRQREAQREADRKASDAAEEAAEGFAWAARKDGSHPSPRIFVPGGKP